MLIFIYMLLLLEGQRSEAWEPSNYEVVSKIFRTGAANYTTVVVARSTGPNRPNSEFWVLLRRFAATT
jgi:hypothetical protein